MHRQLEYLINMFKLTAKKTPKFHADGHLCNLPVTDGFPKLSKLAYNIISIA